MDRFWIYFSILDILFKEVFFIVLDWFEIHSTKLSLLGHTVSKLLKNECFVELWYF